ncbi:hypothetical protein EB796_018779 [Bugula neritina]|uniref:Uncharacterized protein n=1 Tax=Bugula neritina TaxID=10212 RepID=A0A7J7JA94_BUGNE|nr:hypothetical protein EB796_018779 [Bugula neritina]
MAAKGSNSKKGFDYKMSKKVAELTQVVHMLFTRNHEREVEIQMTKELYNKELDRIHLSYKKKIDSLEKELNLATEKLNSNSSEEVLRTKIDQALLELESKWSKKFDSKESQYLTEKMNNVALKESLTRVEQELSLLQTSMADSSQTLNMQLMSKKKEVDQLNRKLAEQCKEYEQLSTVLQTTSAQHREESQTLRSMLSESQSKEVSTAKKLQQVESELKSLKREITRKSSIELTSSRRSANIPNSNDTDGSVNYQKMKEELENLKKLVQKYRLELSNREGNFNRMFTEKVPVHVDQRSLKPVMSVSTGRERISAHTPPESEERLVHGNPTRVDGERSSRKSVSFTGLRRSIAPMSGRRLLTQYNHQQNFPA